MSWAVINKHFNVFIPKERLRF